MLLFYGIVALLQIGGMGCLLLFALSESTSVNVRGQLLAGSAVFAMLAIIFGMVGVGEYIVQNLG